MAEASAAPHGAATTDVKVLSQLSGSDQTYTFTALPTKTTVRELKAKLADSLSSKPPAEHQRLIYRGRLLARDSDLLQDIFGKDASQPHILHLVVREAAIARGAQDTGSTLPFTGAPAIYDDSGTASFSARRAQHDHPLPTTATMPPTSILGNTPNPPPVAAAVHPQTPFNTLNAQHPIPRHPHGPAPAIVYPQPLPHQTFDQAALLHGHPPMPAYFAPPAMYGNMAFTNGQLPQIHAAHPAAAVTPQQAAGAATAGNPISRDQAETSRASNNTSQPSGETGPLHTSHSTGPMNGNIQASITHEPRTGGAPPATGVRHAAGPNGEIITFTYTTSGPMPPTLLNGAPPPMMPFANAFGMRPLPGALPNQAQAPMQAPQGTNGISNWNWNNMPPLGIGQEYFGVEHAVESMRLFQNNLNNLHERVRDHSSSRAPNPGLAAGFRAPVQSIVRTRNRAQQLLNTLLLPGQYNHHEGFGAQDVSRFQQMNSQFSTSIESILRDIERIQTGSPPVSQGTNEPLANQPRSGSPNTAGPNRTAAQSNVQTSTAPQQAVPITAYILNSPSGPQAVVYNAQGAFSSSTGLWSEPQAERPDPIFQQLRSLASNPRLHRNPQERVEDRVARAREAVNSLNRELASANEALTAASSAVTNMHNTNASARSNRRAQENEAQNEAPRADEGQAQPAQAQAQVQPVNDANDFGNILFQTLWHLWTVVRVFAFIWLFTRGMSTRRTILLVIASALYVAAQAGLFGTHLDRLRRHFEALVGLPPQQPEGPTRPAEGANPRDDQEQNQPPHAGNTAAESNAPNRSRLPDPQAVADRLLRERRDQDRSWLSERLVPVERALALFLASLYPGVGERHIQARERYLAEQRRRQEEAERASTEAAAQAAQASEGVAATGQVEDGTANITRVEPTPAASSASAEGSSSSAQVQEGSVRERATAGQARSEEVSNR